MNIDPRIARGGPVVLGLVILAGGWMIVQPRVGESSRTARELEDLRLRLSTVHASIAAPLPAGLSGDPAAAFEQHVAVGDATPRLLEQLARLAATAPAAGRA